LLSKSSHQRTLWLLAIAVCSTRIAGAQIPSAVSNEDPVTISADAVFYADNNEFFSMFRTGETVLGTWMRLNTDIKVSERATLRFGAYGLTRDGCESFDRDNSASSACGHEVARPVASLILGTEHHRFILGTLETGSQPEGIGPDRMTPHGLLPALAVEQSWLDHGYEAGAQWIEDSSRWKHDMWFDYRNVVTDLHREFFNSGFIGHVQQSPTSPIAFGYQFQVVHHGGQQFHTGTVSDSFGGGPGVILRHQFPVVGNASFETYALYSFDRPDRENDALSVKGNALFFRIAAEKNDWRAHVIGWQGHDFKHEDGDPNYLSYIPDLQQNFEGHRDYYELGLTHVVRAAKAIDFEISGRAHYTQDRWGYSYRLVGITHFGIWRGSFK
jgi:hypothetical protein